ncbi:MAG: aromatic amino acid ammonia-lyase [Chitinophagaceae bacterium]|nr:aromatic amino acid ammonia-lyase [Chitinophagaceae bacterium]
MNNIVLNGENLSLEKVIKIAIAEERVSIDTSRLQKSKDYIYQKVKEKKIIYGITTGFGSNVDKSISIEESQLLQIPLLRSHACGVGKNFSTEIVRAIMVIRLNTLLKGYSGVQESTVRQLEFFLNEKIHPLIPEQGSVGASGDLCPLSHMGLALIGEGEVEYKGTPYKTQDLINANTIPRFVPIVLGYKEALALNNGTTVIAAVGVIALYKALRILKNATFSSAFVFEGLCARKDAFAYAKIHEIRNHKGQTEIARWLTHLLKESEYINISQKEILQHLVDNEKIPSPLLKELSEISRKEKDTQEQIPQHILDAIKVYGSNEVSILLHFAKRKWKPQDAYSIRCIPQVLGASKTAIDHALFLLENELNAAVDNPLIFAEDNRVISGGNFHGQPIALVMDYVKLALAEIGNIMERQINKMVDSHTNDFLPRFLTSATGVNNGVMILQYVAASLVSENKVLVHPASADSIPTCENTEDHVSMGTIAARQALEIAHNIEKIIAINFIVGFYALTIRREQFAEVKLQRNNAIATNKLYDLLKTINPPFQEPSFWKTDRFFSPEIKQIIENMDTIEKLADEMLPLMN